MPQMTGGQALAKSLYREGVRVIFGLPGVQLYHLLDGLYDEPGIRFITTRHEQATSYMADGYARAGGGIGTALVVPGPGLQNASAGIGTAYAASSPILVISGQIERDLIGVDRGMLHEVNDQMDTIRPVTKWAARILQPQDVPATVHEAFRQLKTGRPRPVEIEIPPETLAEEADIELLEPANPLRPAASAEQIQTGAVSSPPRLVPPCKRWRSSCTPPCSPPPRAKGPCPIGTPWRWGPCVCVRIRSWSTWRRRMSCWRWARAWPFLRSSVDRRWSRLTWTRRKWGATMRPRSVWSAMQNAHWKPCTLRLRPPRQ